MLTGVASVGSAVKPSKAKFVKPSKLTDREYAVLAGVFGNRVGTDPIVTNPTRKDGKNLAAALDSQSKIMCTNIIPLVEDYKKAYSSYESGFTSPYNLQKPLTALSRQYKANVTAARFVLNPNFAEQSTKYKGYSQFTQATNTLQVDVWAVIPDPDERLGKNYTQDDKLLYSYAKGFIAALQDDELAVHTPNGTVRYSSGQVERLMGYEEIYSNLSKSDSLVFYMTGLQKSNSGSEMDEVASILLNLSKNSPTVKTRLVSTYRPANPFGFYPARSNPFGPSRTLSERMAEVLRELQAKDLKRIEPARVNFAETSFQSVYSGGFNQLIKDFGCKS
jgi:hypothetical protein